MELKHQLGLLRDIWALFENAKEAAKALEETEREKRRKAKRKREENDTDTYSLTTRRTTRSQSRSANGGYNGPPSSSHSDSRACTQPGGSDTHKRSTQVANKRKRKLGSSSLSGAMLTETAMQHLSKRQKTADLNTTVIQWVESTCG
jgi:hypothetical protein